MNSLNQVVAYSTSGRTDSAVSSLPVRCGMPVINGFLCSRYFGNKHLAILTDSVYVMYNSQNSGFVSRTRKPFSQEEGLKMS
jgi:hypothetical protein